jgi:competence protein ComEA
MRTETGDDEETEESPPSLVPRWLPDAEPGGKSWQDRWADLRADPGRAGAMALAGVAGIAILVTVVTLLRDDSPPVVSANLPPVEMAASATVSPPAPTPSAPAGPVVVSVVGLVQRPGLVTVTPGARVADAIEQAGGVLAGADTVGLNMARHLGDGEQVVVGLAPAPGQPPALGSSISGAIPSTPGAPAASPTEGGGPLDLNTATVDQLDALPGIGPVTAEAIVAWRTQHGAFSSVDQLGEVNGIGPTRLERLRDQVRV